MSQREKKVVVTGGAGQIAYQLLFSLCSGEVFGQETLIHLSLLEREEALGALEGVKMELFDSAFPLLKRVDTASDPYKAFEGADFVICIGAHPRKKGMERKDLLEGNGRIFKEQGEALYRVVEGDTKVVVVGNPVNTNALILHHYAKKLSSVYALTRLDQNRAVFQLAKKGNVGVEEVTQMGILGNHSKTMVPDYTHALIRGKKACDWIQDEMWLQRAFFKEVQERGGEVIKARGHSSAASAAKSISDTIRSIEGLDRGWCSCGVLSDGNRYGIEEGLIFSLPCVFKEGVFSPVENLMFSPFIREKMKISEEDLLMERDLIRHLLRG